MTTQYQWVWMSIQFHFCFLVSVVLFFAFPAKAILIRQNNYMDSDELVIHSFSRVLTYITPLHTK